MGTTGVDLVVIGFSSLDAVEQEAAFERIGQLRLERLAGEEGETARYLRSFQVVADYIGDVDELNSATYRQVADALRKVGDDVLGLNAQVRFWGSWREAREAFDLSTANSDRQIEARFAKRKLAKVWRYDETSLRTWLETAVETLGHVPLAAELDHLRQRELEKARARGDDAVHLPSVSAYRRRYGTYEKALLGLGFTPDQVAERLDRS